MYLSQRWKSHDRGEQKRAELLQAIAEHGQESLPVLALAIGISTDQVRRHIQSLKIAGLLGILIFSILPALSGNATEKISQPIGSTEYKISAVPVDDPATEEVTAEEDDDDGDDDTAVIEDGEDLADASDTAD
jgi:hypothetical protein